ncbi:hypothetical protein CL689_02940 [Candidatus Saccharibacteria bacterium]|nr:hypothetical protein [Candidatus Saccharibacteria bacterium]|tara:strand:- start:3933 stop:4226 length:294 start_codon:yes stop_codon:yes gene_type:complete
MLDLTKPFTVDDVRRLIASKDDAKPRQIRVTKEGVAFLSDSVGSRDLDGILFRFETLDAGNGYTGKDAALDDHWVSKIHDVLKSNWPKPFDSYIDSY